MTNSVTRDFLSRVGFLPALGDLRREAGYRLGAPLLSRPVFLTADEHARLAADTTALFDLVTAIPERIFGGDRAAHAAAVGIGPRERLVIEEGADLPCPAMGRADYYRADDGFRLLEFNVGSNIGGWDIGVVADRALADPTLAPIVAAHGLGHVDPRPAVLAALRRTAGREFPRVGVLGAPGAQRPGMPYFPVLVAFFRALGFDAVGGNLGQLDDRPDGLHLDGRRVDVAYRVFNILDVRDDPAMVGAMAMLHRHAHDGAIALHGPLTTEPAMSKVNLALLSDPANHGALASDERDLVTRTVPWTRVVAQGRTDVGGVQVDLLDHILAHRRNLVLKPALSFGGAGVVPGWTVTERQWADAVAVAMREPHVVQERVTPQAERFHSPEDPPLTGDYTLTWGAFVVDGQYVGAIVRGLPESGGSVVNQDTGAGFAAVLHAAHHSP